MTLNESSGASLQPAPWLAATWIGVARQQKVECAVCSCRAWAWSTEASPVLCSMTVPVLMSH
jgi:hypothetical protein